MNYLKISSCSLCDGLGVRVVLWVSGCTHHCEGCHNQCSWQFDVGKPFNEETMSKIYGELKKPYIKGITFSGGDPLNPKNIGQITEITKAIKENFPSKDIWCYTGYLWEEVKDLPVMQYVDYLVDGEFQLDKRDITLAFKGSSNQRIVYKNREIVG